jgi:hypothetical protein
MHAYNFRKIVIPENLNNLNLIIEYELIFKKKLSVSFLIN